MPTALTIAGSDSGGGAGIQADLKTFAALQVHGTSAITCITAQNPRQVLGDEGCSAKILREQIVAVGSELKPAAAKTGMLYGRAQIQAVVQALKHLPKRSKLVVDPVMISTSGKRLLAANAVSFLKNELLPLATLVTPNLDETAILCGRRIHSIEQMREAAREIQARFGCAALIKGGHLKGSTEAIDIFWDGQDELLLASPFVRGVSTHGTGCTYSAAICAALAKGHRLTEAVVIGKRYITTAIANSCKTGRHFVLGEGV